MAENSSATVASGVARRSRWAAAGGASAARVTQASPLRVREQGIGALRAAEMKWATSERCPKAGFGRGPTKGRNPLVSGVIARTPGAAHLFSILPPTDRHD